MSPRDIAINNLILKTKTGSFLYGTDTKTSDKDYVGVFIPPVEYYIRTKTAKEVDLSTMDKNNDGRNSSNAIDFKVYEFSKFIKLLSECNPNILELVFSNEYEVISDLGMEIVNNRSLFVHKGLYKKFIGYSLSQKHRMMIRSDNYSALEEVLEFLLKGDNPSKTFSMLSYNENIKTYASSVSIGDLSFPMSSGVSKAIDCIRERLSKATNRSDLITKYGYDTKFASHSIRILLECIELLDTGELSFPLKCRNYILDIKNGRYSLEEIIKASESLEKECKACLEKTKLPNSADCEKIDELMIRTVKTHWTRKRD